MNSPDSPIDNFCVWWLTDRPRISLCLWRAFSLLKRELYVIVNCLSLNSYLQQTWLKWAAVSSFKWENAHLSPRLMSSREIDGTAPMEFRNPQLGRQYFWEHFFVVNRAQDFLIYSIPVIIKKIVWYLLKEAERKIPQRKIWSLSFPKILTSVCPCQKLWCLSQCCGKVYVDEGREGKWMPLQGAGQWATKYFHRLNRIIWQKQVDTKNITTYYQENKRKQNIESERTH